MKGISLKMCRLCVPVIINKHSFEPFMCLNHPITDTQLVNLWNMSIAPTQPQKSYQHKKETTQHPSFCTTQHPSLCTTSHLSVQHPIFLYNTPISVYNIPIFLYNWQSYTEHNPGVTHSTQLENKSLHLFSPTFRQCKTHLFSKHDNIKTDPVVPEMTTLRQAQWYQRGQP